MAIEDASSSLGALNGNVDTSRLYETPDTMEAKSLLLGSQIMAHCANTRLIFDNLVAVPRGGLSAVSTIARQFGYGADELLSTHVSSYAGGDMEGGSNFRVGQMPTKEQVEGKNLLVIDEVWDKGRTLDFLTKWLASNGAAAVMTGVVYYKPKRSQVTGKPDFWVEETDKWIVFPGEQMELDRIESPLDLMRQGVFDIDLLRANGSSDQI